MRGFVRVAATPADQTLPEGLQPIETVFADFLPPAWFEVHPKPRIWFTVFRIANLHPDLVLTNSVAFDTAGLRAVLFHGRIPYYDTSGLKLELRGDSTLHFQDSGEIQGSPEAPWLVFFGLYDTGEVDPETEVKARISIAKGLLVAVLGRNVAFEELCANVYNLESSRYSGFSNVWPNPYVYSAPSLDTEKFDRVKRIYEKIENQPDSDRNRLRLSLHWFEMGHQESGIDAFLRRWTALEVLARCRTGGDLKAIKKLIGKAYGLPAQAAATEFYIGWLSQIRANIVHHGRIRNLHYGAPLYLEEVYKDCLMATLDMPPIGAARACKGRADLNIHSLLKGLL